MSKLYVIGIGPGGTDHMSQLAIKALEESDVIVGYAPYLDYVKDFIKDKETFSSQMGGEIKRCKKAIELAQEGKTVSIISTGDAGLYGMAGPIYELASGLDIDIQVVPGITSAFSAAAELGSPIMHDAALISLSDLMTPWDLILKRVELASEADFVICLYNPRSKGRPDHLSQALEKILLHKSLDTPVGLVKNSGRDGNQVRVATIRDLDVEEVDMHTVLIIGNQATYIEDGKIITPRGYDI